MDHKEIIRSITRSPNKETGKTYPLFAKAFPVAAIKDLPLPLIPASLAKKLKEASCQP